jgi:hypothetical protein
LWWFLSAKLVKLVITPFGGALGLYYVVVYGVAVAVLIWLYLTAMWHAAAIEDVFTVEHWPEISREAIRYSRYDGPTITSPSQTET